MAFVSESYDEIGDAPPAISTTPLEDGGFDVLDSERLGSYSEFNQDSADDATVFSTDQRSASFLPEDDVFAAPESEFHSNANGESVDEVYVYSDGPILPPPSEMSEEVSALGEWRRENAARLEEKEKIEKEAVSQIIQEASEYKVAFYEKRKVICENNKTTNREKEKVFVTNTEKFHKEADQDYWKAIAELIPNEVPALEKRRGGKKEQEKKPSVSVFQGPKPGKATDLSRMRHILVKLKHSAPPHLNLSPPIESEKADAPSKTAATGPEAIAAA